jgi:DNA-binding LacI/PurR family transcriptional regulator
MTRPVRIVRQPLYEQVAVILRDEILLKYRPGQRLDSESALVTRLGVSAVTLRQAISALAQEGLIERRHGSGNYVGPSREAAYVALVTELLESGGDTAFQTRVFRRVGEELSERGFIVRHYAKPARTGWSDLSHDIRTGRVRGAVFVAMNPGELAGELDQRRVPFVNSGETYAHPFNVDTVNVIQQGTRYLLDRGCRKIALMQWAQEGAEQSKKAFAGVMAEYRATVREKWIQQSISPIVPGAGWEHFREMWVTRDEKPDGLLVTDDMIMRDVAMAILDLRIKIPGQLQVIAQTNKGSGLNVPFPVASLEVDPNEMAVAMAETLARLMRQETVAPGVQSITPKLILPKARLKQTESVS